DLGNQGIHQMDVARWFLNQHRLPPRVWSVGGRLGYQDAGDTPNTQLVWHDYQPAPLLFEVRGLPRSSRFQQNGRWGGDVMDRFRGSQIGVVVQCEQGNVLVPSNSSRVAAFDLQGRQIKEWRGGGAHHENWLRAIASGDADQLAAPIVEGHVSSALCHAGNISYRLGRPANAEAVAETVRGDDLLSGAFERMASHLRANGVDVDNVESLTLGAALEIDGDAESFVGPRGDAANQLRKRKYRDPFVVPDIQRDLAAGAVSSS
ncbi:MAG: gfo/Idh/MocA family oxidoreductase, partial [Planctomycetota bacterium]